jgi:hypothetical protein
MVDLMIPIWGNSSANQVIPIFFVAIDCLIEYNSQIFRKPLDVIAAANLLWNSVSEVLNVEPCAIVIRMVSVRVVLNDRYTAVGICQGFVDILPALKDGDSLYRRSMSRTGKDIQRS